MSEKLTIEHLAPYLPYGLKMNTTEGDFEVTSVYRTMGIKHNRHRNYERWSNDSALFYVW
jgi:hypothetical protein